MHWFHDLIDLDWGGGIYVAVSDLDCCLISDSLVASIWFALVSSVCSRPLSFVLLSSLSRWAPKVCANDCLLTTISCCADVSVCAKSLYCSCKEPWNSRVFQRWSVVLLTLSFASFNLSSNSWASSCSLVLGNLILALVNSLFMSLYLSHEFGDLRPLYIFTVLVGI